MELAKYRSSFEKMDYDTRTPQEPEIRNTRSTVIISETADLATASDFVASSFQSSDLFQISVILVQESVSDKFIQLLEDKLKPMNTESLDTKQIEAYVKELSMFSKLGFQLIQSTNVDDRIKSSIVKAAKQKGFPEDLPIITLDVFRTTKEAIHLASGDPSISLWIENLSVAFEYTNGLHQARQIWLNSSHGITHPKCPFYNGSIIFKGNVSSLESVIRVHGNIQFQTFFRCDDFKEFKTVVIPFGSTFGN